MELGVVVHVVQHACKGVDRHRLPRIQAVRNVDETRAPRVGAKHRRPPAHVAHKRGRRRAHIDRVPRLAVPRDVGLICAHCFGAGEKSGHRLAVFWRHGVQFGRQRGHAAKVVNTVLRGHHVVDKFFRSRHRSDAQRAGKVALSIGQHPRRVQPRHLPSGHAKKFTQFGARRGRGQHRATPCRPALGSCKLCRRNLMQGAQGFTVDRSGANIGLDRAALSSYHDR